MLRKKKKTSQYFVDYRGRHQPRSGLLWRFIGPYTNFGCPGLKRISIQSCHSQCTRLCTGTKCHHYRNVSLISGHPSHAVFFQFHEKFRENSEDIILYPEVLRNAGYYCTNNTKEDYNFNLKRAIWDESGKSAHWKNRPDKRTPFFSIFNLTMTHESCINNQEKHERMTQDLPDHLRTDSEKIVVPPTIPIRPK